VKREKGRGVSDGDDYCGITNSSQQRERATSLGTGGPGAWAVTAFATTSFMLGWYNAGEIGSASLPIVFPVAFFFGGLVQIVVGVLEIARGNLFGGSCSAPMARSG
jgi:succinate-acetate transporter protein